MDGQRDDVVVLGTVRSLESLYFLVIDWVPYDVCKVVGNWCASKNETSKENNRSESCPRSVINHLAGGVRG